jgi:hypothetical protein
MALYAWIPGLTADPVVTAAQRLEWARRRRAAAFEEAAQAKRRLEAAEEQLREARVAARAARAPAGGPQMIGMGYFADEIAVVEAA